MMRKLILWGVAVMILGFLCASAVTYISRWHGWKPTIVEGVILRRDSDARKQVPVSQAEITVTNGRFEATTQSDPAGYFKLEMKPSWQTRQTIKLLVRHVNYEPVELPAVTGSQLYIVHLSPKDAAAGSNYLRKRFEITDVRLRYSIKTATTTNIGSAATTFEAPGEAGTPCNHKLPCSPDGKWKAVSSSQTFDAGERSEFRNARLSCIAGPCPFTRAATTDFGNPARIIKVTVDNWSNAATFVLEAEVTRTTATDMVRQGYPVIFGSAMNFTLPASAEGPSIEATLDGQFIVFPLGPDLNLSWADCSGQPAADNAQQYRCILKPGYQFQ